MMPPSGSANCGTPYGDACSVHPCRAPNRRSSGSVDGPSSETIGTCAPLSIETGISSTSAPMRSAAGRTLQREGVRAQVLQQVVAARAGHVVSAARPG